MSSWISPPISRQASRSLFSSSNNNCIGSVWRAHPHDARAGVGVYCQSSRAACVF
jgi:hypothetical protein